MKSVLTTFALLLVAFLRTGCCEDSAFAAIFAVETTVGRGSFTVNVWPAWAPIGAKRLRDLIEARFYDDSRFFRVIPDFMAQFGLPGDPSASPFWETIPDDPVIQSNTRGFVSFAKTNAPDSRTTQLFINYADNSFLDATGFAPVGKVCANMVVVEDIYPVREQPSQVSIRMRGNEYLDSEFPLCSKIVSVRLVNITLPPGECGDGSELGKLLDSDHLGDFDSDFFWYSMASRGTNTSEALVDNIDDGALAEVDGSDEKSGPFWSTPDGHMWIAFIVLLMLVIAVGGAVFMYLRKKPPRPAQGGQVEFDVLEDEG